MSWFAEPNQDALTITPDRVTTGPRVGFMRAFETAYETQVRGASLFGIQEAMRNREDRQRKRLRDAGVENIPSISQQADDPLRMFTDFGQDYIDATKFYENGGDPEIGVRLREYDKRVEELKVKFPQLDLETSIDMWRGVKSEAQQFEQRAATERTDLGGAVGAFAGGAVGSLNPNTDPLNFATLPLGGAGKTVLGRVAGQAGAQGLVEGFNQGIGVQEQRRLLGLGYGPGDAIMRIGGAAIGGAAVQGFGEVVGYGFRKMFKGRDVPDVALPPPPPRMPASPEGATPTEPATVAATYVERPQAFYDFMNQVSPTGNTRAGKARAIDDLTFVESHLDAWDGPAPWDVPPKTDTAPVRSLSDFTKIPNIQDIAFKADIDAMARRVDPETFAKYDKYADQYARIDELKSVTEAVDAKGEPVRVYHGTPKAFKGDFDLKRAGSRNASGDDGIAFTSDKVVAEGYKGKGLFNRGEVKEAYLDMRNPRVVDMSAHKGDTLDMMTTKGIVLDGARADGHDGVIFKNIADNKDLGDTRSDVYIVFDPKQIVTVDGAAKAGAELQPLIERAYARAKGDWSATAAERIAVAEMVSKGNKKLGPTPDSERLVEAAMLRNNIEDRIPVLQQRPEGMKPDSDAADVQMRVYDERSKAAEDAATVFTADAKRLVAQAEKLDEMTPEQKRKATLEREPGELPPDQFKVPGYDEPMSLNEKIEVMNEDTGAIESISVRELLQRQVDADEDLKAVSSCSLR